MDYSERLLRRGNILTRLSHRRRFACTADLLGHMKNVTVLDFGCADGFLLWELQGCGVVGSGYGVDEDPDALELARHSFAEIPGFDFYPASEQERVPPGTCDLAICTETLEHVNDPARALEYIVSRCKPGATLLVSVPIEVGPSLLGKQFGRYLANLKGHYGYPRYSWLELMSAGFLGMVHRRQLALALGREQRRGHKGFDYREIGRELTKRSTIRSVTYTPLPWFGPFANSTVIWICSIP